jgi:hypothetical protein
MMLTAVTLWPVSMENAQIPVRQEQVSSVDLTLSVMFLTMWLSAHAQLDILEIQIALLWDASKWNVFQVMTAHSTDSVMARVTDA